MNQTLQLPVSTAPSFERSAKPLLLALKPSRAWLVFLLALHMLALTAIVIAAAPILIKVMSMMCAAASLFYHLKLHKQTTQLVWRTGNRWFINDEPGVAELCAVNFLSRPLVILSLQPENSEESLVKKVLSRRKFIIPADGLDSETFRLLRVRLRIEANDLLNPRPETIM